MRQRNDTSPTSSRSEENHTLLPPARAVPEPRAEPRAEPRYDTVTVKRVIARAETMQAHHHALVEAAQAEQRQTLSAEEIEALADELSIEARFVRRALTQVQADRQTEAARASEKRAKRALFRRACHMVVRPVRAPLFCLLGLSATLPWFFTPRPAVNWFYFYLPCAFAFGLTAIHRPKSERGALRHALHRGIGFGVAGLGALFFSATVNHLGYPDPFEFTVVAAAFLGGTLIAALTGAAVGATLRGGFGKLLAAAEAAETAEAAEKSPTTKRDP